MWYVTENYRTFSKTWRRLSRSSPSWCQHKKIVRIHHHENRSIPCPPCYGSPCLCTNVQYCASGEFHTAKVLNLSFKNERHLICSLGGAAGSPCWHVTGRAGVDKQPFQAACLLSVDTSFHFLALVMNHHWPSPLDLRNYSAASVLYLPRFQRIPLLAKSFSLKNEKIRIRKSQSSGCRPMAL